MSQLSRDGYALILNTLLFIVKISDFWGGLIGALAKLKMTVQTPVPLSKCLHGRCYFAPKFVKCEKKKSV